MSKAPQSEKNNLLSKRKIKKQVKEVMEANRLFAEFADVMKEKEGMEEKEINNFLALKDHMTNLNVYFVDVLKSIK